jgi:uncharacterized membrane protein
MSKFIVTIFSNETQAYEGVHALKQLDDEGSITLFETAVVEREANGKLIFKARTETPLVGGGLGALVGALIGVLGGPVGAGVGAAAGALAGGGVGLLQQEVSEEFLEDIARGMTPGKFAVLAEVSERWTAPIDTRMASLGGKVLRENRSDVIDDLIDKRVQAHRAEVEERKARRASERAQHMEAEFESDVREAAERLQRTADKARKRLDETQAELDRKLQKLEAQAAKAKPDTKKELQERVIEVRGELSERRRKLEHAWQTASEALRQ